MAAYPPYPVRLESRLDPGLSRWLWLVKWLLVIPHYVVLAVLWVAFVVLTVVAFFAILVTGRYPRSIFTFNVGVLRWTWRVAHYSYGALGTDRYPPFTLEDVPDHPASLDVSYPHELSRGLVLVKSWLLALPHYVVLGFVVGGGLWVVGGGEARSGAASTGLLGVLVLVAGVVLAVTGRYPAGLYDLVVGLNRWVFRVVAYAALMTDAYPPFRLDLGGHEPGARGPQGPLVDPAGDHAQAAGQDSQAPRHDPVRAGQQAYGGTATHSSWTAVRVVAVVTGALLVVASLGLLGAGGTALWADQTQRDRAGYVTTDTRTFATDTHALVATPLEIALDRPADAVWLQRTLGTVRLSVDGAPGRELFVGVGPAADVATYLDGVAVDRVRDIPRRGAVSYERRQGDAQPAAPDTQDLWAASTSGAGALALDWEAQDGSWTVVIMNRDGTPGVQAEARAGATVPALTWVSVGLLLAGALLLLAGLVLMIAAASAARPQPPAGPTPSVPGPRGWSPAPTPTGVGPSAGPPAS
jgi:hypothetical protein